VNNANACDDGNACTTGDACAFGSCHAGAAVNCNDGNVCTTDTCDAATGCVNANNTAACSDGNACTTNDTCVGGACGGVPLLCDDGNVCTTDTCDAVTGCVFTNNANACDDGNDCTAGDFCAIGTCRPGTATAQISVRVSDEHVGAAGGSLDVPLQAFPAGGTALDLTLSYDPAVVSATGASLTAITLGASLSVDLSTPGAVRVTINRAVAFSGTGPVAMVHFTVIGAAGASSALSLSATSVNSFAVSSCGDGGHVVVCGDLPAELAGVMVSGKGVSTITWTAVPSAVSYDVTENFITRLRSDGSAVNAACLSHGGAQTSASDTHSTPVGDGFYYMVRAVTACAKGTFGTGSYGETRTPVNTLACP
jgi:hypothetical protein